ncbi:MAG TPA: DUF4124 domain-containing protein [Burkholderiales bacterium]|jgi:hypothetical protein
MLVLLRTLLVVAFAVSAPSWAETCKYLDANGHVIYSNTPNNPPKGAKKVRCFADPTPKQPPAAEAQPRSSDAPRSDFPKVDSQTQKKRDGERRRILEEELAAEEQQLDAAKQRLAEAESVRTGEERNYQKFLDRVQPFRDAVANHERNIEAIKREITNLK